MALFVAILALFGCRGSDSAAQGMSTNRDPLASAREGLLLCIRPKIDKRECNTLTRYVFDSESAIDAHADVTMSAEVVMSLKFVTTIQSGAVCSAFREEDTRSATFTIAGRPASAQETSFLRDQVASNMRIRPTGVTCLNFLTSPQGLVAQVILDEVRHPEMDEPVIWISPDQGYVAHP